MSSSDLEKTHVALNSLRKKQKDTDLFSHQTRQKDIIHLLDELRFINARNKERLFSVFKTKNYER